MTSSRIAKQLAAGLPLAVAAAVTVGLAAATRGADRRA